MQNQTPPPDTRKTFYLPGLNGLRAIAALAVVISHTTLGLAAFGLDPAVLGTTADGKPKGLLLAGFGVSIFFTLSGFLITYLLLMEKERFGISLPKFYLRRILRIWPLYYLYLAVVLGVLWCQNEDFLPDALPFYIFFMPNVPFILGNLMPYLAHYWSLGVEEQFYLFWPVVVKRTRRLLLVILTAIAVLIGAKLMLHVLLPHSVAEMALHVTRFHCMLIGAAGAILHRNGYAPYIHWIDKKLTQAAAWFVVFLLVANQFHVASVIDNELVSLVTVALIVGQANRRHALFNLENEVFDFLGKISYGIYVIHPLIILLCTTVIGPLLLPSLPAYALAYGSVLSLTIGAAYVSYRFVEKPLLRLKTRFTVIPSSGTRHFDKQKDLQSGT